MLKNKTDLDSIWNETLNLIKESEHFSSHIYNSWIKNSSLYDLSDDFAVIVVPNLIQKTVIINDIDFIQAKLSQVLDREVACQIFMRSEISNFSTKPEPKKIKLENKVMSRYTFDNFIVGQSNRESHAAALACAHNPGKFFNPLFIFGNSGLGKTHLLHAIGNYVKQNSPNMNVLYIYSEDFINLIVNALRDATIDQVKDAICDVDILLIDDIQRLKKGEKSQEIFFNLYNKLVSENKQIVITSDIHPTELRGIETRLISRFSSGLTVGVDSPEFETALAILQEKLKGREQAVLFDVQVLEYVANKFSSDVRRLEGALNELIFKSVLYNPDKIDLPFALDIFKDEPDVVISKQLDANAIKRAVCEFYGLTKQQIESKSRTKNIANARHIAIYLIRTCLEMPFMKIGEEFGGRDHSTIMTSYDKIQKMLKDNPLMKEAVDRIKDRLGIKS